MCNLLKSAACLYKVVLQFHSLISFLYITQALRGFAGTSLLILVGVATDSARKVKAEQAMQKYRDVDSLYDDMDIK